MFSFLKPEVSGMKNILNAYATYKQQMGVMADLSSEQMFEFADWYFRLRLGPQMVGSDSPLKFSIARERFAAFAGSNPTFINILQGLLIAEGQDGNALFFDDRAIAKVFDKYPPIDPSLMGI